MQGTAYFSDCGRYRYALTRHWDTGPTCTFVGLNPSNADATKDDATVRKCVRFAQTWGYAGMSLVNLFARRCRYPQALKTSADPVGPDNDRWLASVLDDAPLGIAMWGNPGLRAYGDVSRRDLTVLARHNHWLCFGLTRQGAPKHPLYLPSTTALCPFNHDCIQRT